MLEFLLSYKALPLCVVLLVVGGSFLFIVKKKFGTDVKKERGYK